MTTQNYMSEHPLVLRVRDRILNRNQNWLAVVVGDVGSGKSYTALALAEAIDPDFTIDRVAFGAREFLNLINNGNLHRGSSVVFDEVGCGMPARDFFTLQNKLLSTVFQTFRTDNIACIFTCPSLGYIDVQLRHLFHFYLETLYIDQEQEEVALKPMIVQHNPKLAKTYYKYERRAKDGKLLTINKLYVPKPSPRLAEAYESQRKKYTAHLKANAEGKVEEMEEKDKPKKTMVELAEEIDKNREILSHNGKLSKPKIMDYLKIGRIKTEMLIKLCEQTYSLSNII